VPYLSDSDDSRRGAISSVRTLPLPLPKYKRPYSSKIIKSSGGTTAPVAPVVQGTADFGGIFFSAKEWLCFVNFFFLLTFWDTLQISAATANLHHSDLTSREDLASGGCHRPHKLFYAGGGQQNCGSVV